MSPEVRHISLPVAVAIVVANMVGTGVFTSLGFQVADLPSGFPIVLLWVTGGVVSICGALCYAELGAMMPRSGGEYHLLRESYCPLPGFLAGWVSITVGFAAPIAAAAVALGAYLAEITGQPEPCFSVTAVLGVAAIHLGSVSVTGRFQLLATSAKVILILVLIAAALSMADPQKVSFAPAVGDLALIGSPAFATSLVFVMYAYTGWNAAAYIAGEVKNPERNLPLALLVGTAVVTVLYVMLNVAFLRAAPMDAIAGQPEVGLIAAKGIFGATGGKVMGALIGFGLVSTISSMTWAGPRVAAVMGEDYVAFRWLSRRNRFGVPARAVMLQTIVALALVVSMKFDQLIYYIQSILILSGTLTVLAVVWLRFRRPQASRPYRVPLVGVPVAIFAIMSTYMLIFQATQKPFSLAMGMVTLALGCIVYAFAKRKDSLAS